MWTKKTVVIKRPILIMSSISMDLSDFMQTVLDNFLCNYNFFEIFILTWFSIWIGLTNAGVMMTLDASPETMINRSGLTLVIRRAASSAATFQSVALFPKPHDSGMWPRGPPRILWKKYFFTPLEIYNSLYLFAWNGPYFISKVSSYDSWIVFITVSQ